MSYDLLVWNAWARNATPDQIAEKLTQQQDEVATLRSVCRVAAGVVKAATTMIGDRKYVCGALNDVGRDLEQAGKEATDGQ